MLRKFILNSLVFKNNISNKNLRKTLKDINFLFTTLYTNKTSR